MLTDSQSRKSRCSHSQCSCTTPTANVPLCIKRRLFLSLSAVLLLSLKFNYLVSCAPTSHFSFLPTPTSFHSLIRNAVWRLDPWTASSNWTLRAASKGSLSYDVSDDGNLEFVPFVHQFPRGATELTCVKLCSPT